MKIKKTFSYLHFSWVHFCISNPQDFVSFSEEIYTQDFASFSEEVYRFCLQPRMIKNLSFSFLLFNWESEGSLWEIQGLITSRSWSSWVLMTFASKTFYQITFHLNRTGASSIWCLFECLCSTIILGLEVYALKWLNQFIAHQTMKLCTRNIKFYISKDVFQWLRLLVLFVIST